MWKITLSRIAPKSLKTVPVQVTKGLSAKCHSFAVSPFAPPIFQLWIWAIFEGVVYGQKVGYFWSSPMENSVFLSKMVRQSNFSRATCATFVPTLPHRTVSTGEPHHIHQLIFQRNPWCFWSYSAFLRFFQLMSEKEFCKMSCFSVYFTENLKKISDFSVEEKTSTKQTERALQKSKPFRNI